MEHFPQPNRVPVPPCVNADQAAISLMAMAEVFRSAQKYKMAVKCVMTALRVPCSSELFALCSYELGRLLWLYTRNVELSQFHLRNAYQLMHKLGAPLEQKRLEVAALLAEIHLARRCFPECIQVLRSELGAPSQRDPRLHTKMLFLFAEAELRLGEFGRALEVVQAGVQYSREAGGGGVMVECYFRLVKSLVLSIQMTDQHELGKSVGELGEILQSVAASNDQATINDIRAFCYTIQLCYFLAIGMVKSSKQCLRQLHITVQSAEAAKSATAYSTSPDGFPSSSSTLQIRWLSSEMLTGLAYVLTVLCNIQYSNFERSHRYNDIALKHFEGMRSLMRKSSWTVVENRLEEFIARMELLLHESIAQSHLVLGNPRESLNNIASMCRSIRLGRTHLLVDFGPQLHTLLGIYATYMRKPECAEQQFRLAIKSTKDPELWTLAHLGMALAFLFSAREADFYELFEAISPAKLRSHANSIRSAAHLVHAFHYFMHGRHQECKKQLTDSIAISKEEDMSRLQSMALLLLAKLMRTKDVIKMAYEWTNKSGDVGLSLWANSEVYALGGANPGSEDMAKISEDIRTQRERLETNRTQTAQMESNAIIMWTEGEIPNEVCLP